MIFDMLFSGFKWYRKIRGGHWEKWYIGEPVCSTVWINNSHGERPIGAGCLEDCEDYNVKPTSIYPYR